MGCSEDRCYILERQKRATDKLIPQIRRNWGSVPKSFRPYNLTSFPLIIKCLILHKCQHAYRVGIFTKTFVCQSTIAQETLNDKETAINVFLVISGAFDKVSLAFVS